MSTQPATGKTSLWAHPLMVPLGAGSLSGIFADTVTHPVCTIKARMMTRGAAQAAARASGGAAAETAAASLYAGLYKGIGAVLVGAAPAQSLYFGGMLLVQDFAKGGGAVTNFAAGIGAQMCGSIAWVPMEVIKEKMMIQGQFATKEHFSGSFDLARRVVAKEGIGGLYRGFMLQQVTYGPFNAFGVMLYNEFKPMVPSSIMEEHPVLGDLAASAAGYAIAAFVTTPFDVIKTRKQVQTSNPELFNYNGAFDILSKTVKNEGAGALFDGWMARVGWLAPRCSLAMTSFAYLAGVIADKAAAGEQ